MPACVASSCVGILAIRCGGERFVESSRKGGGHLELELFEGEAEGFIGRNSNSPNATRAIEKIIDFVHIQLC